MEPDTGGAKMLGTVQYTAPGCLLGEPATPRSDVFSPGAIAYQMLTGCLPYGADIAKLRTGSRRRKPHHRPARGIRPSIPEWVDGALKKAVHPVPSKRHEAVSEFIHDLRTPNPAFSGAGTVPLAQGDTLLFWKAVSLVLACAVLYLLASRVP